MTEIRINNPIQSGFAMVPDVLWRWPGLSFRAKGFMAYLMSFRQGVAPPVAAMEAETGLGRDARKAAMRELMGAGLARWIVQRDVSGRVVAKALEVTTLPLLAAVASEAAGLRAVHATEKPSDGKSGVARRNFRRSPTEKPVDKEDRETETAAPRPQRRGGAAGSVVLIENHARDAVASGSGEAAKAAENGQGDGEAWARKVGKARMAALQGLRAYCPVSGSWLSASAWLANEAEGRYCGLQDVPQAAARRAAAGGVA